jgi:integrase/recombinase XerD
MQTALRLFLRFCSAQGWASDEHVRAVPRLHRYRLDDVPRALTDEQVSRVLGSVEPTNASGARDLAILLLLATYGVRRGQIVDLRLSDVDWRRRRIVFRAHKGGKAVAHRLTTAVAAALGRYVDRFRPEVVQDHVFLRVHRPYLPVGPLAITGAVKGRLRRAGVDAPLLSPHAFRHAFAKRLLRVGRPLKVVADLLGHRHLASASVYGKVDLVGLRSIAGEWPTVLR